MDHNDFPEFFRAVHDGRDPFPWQSALVRRLFEEGWPAAIDVPTGLGKTAVLDVAVFLAAARPEAGRRRTFFVVDRRLVVDEAYEHALAIECALHSARPGSVAARVARALARPDDDTVLEVARMRGGITWDARWVDRPDRHAIITGTVDQVGSRLLFRGYGVTEQARSLDAALVGTDSLIIVDEAHLAKPFLETAAAIATLDARPTGPPPQLVTMSATVSTDPESAHGITSDDEAHPVAGRRLRASKRAHLVEVRTSRAAAGMAVPDALAELARLLAGPGRVVGVVVNTVARARAVYERLRTRGEAVLLTGRIRPVDRDYLLAEHYPRIRAGRARDPEAPPLLLVATQTIEVGANIDLDALVTESAPLDALVQRLGRLNRLGDHPGWEATALVVHDSSAGEDDPVYGPARVATWRWLVERSGSEPARYAARLDPPALAGGLPASPLALRELMQNRPPELFQEADRAPVLTTSALDAWVRTSPAPHPDPPVEPYLHGLVEPPNTVQVVWRAELSDPDPKSWPEAVEQVPVTAEEAIEVPLPAVRRWLARSAPDAVLSDLDAGAAEPLDDAGLAPPAREGRPRPVLRMRGRADSWPVRPSELVPGDLIVVPVGYGGCDRFGWDPAATKAVVDVADLARRRGRPVLRIGPYLRTVVDEYHRELSGTLEFSELLTLADHVTEPSDVDVGAIRGKLTRLVAARTDGDPRPLWDNLAVLSRPSARTALIAHTLWQVMLAAGSASRADDRSPAGSSVVGKQISLAAHQAAVATRAREFAAGVGLPEPLQECAALAGRLHDEGKQDPRFQAMLWGGSRQRAEVATSLLAKSGMDPNDRAALRSAARQSKYPRGVRHEALSARIATLLLDGSCPDPELVIHLVAAHHGFGRPLLPPVSDPAPEEIKVAGQVLSTGETVDWDGPERFARLNRRYGRWGLALLETVVRLADIWCSARGEEDS